MRETFILTQDIANGQLIDTHPKAGSRMQKLVDKTVIDVFPVLNSSVPITTTTKRLDAELNSLSPAVGSGLGVLTTRKHQVFKAGTDHAFVDGMTIEINADLAYTAALAFSINMSFASILGTTVGNPGDVQIGDFVSIATPVPYFAQILTKVPNGPNFDLTFSAVFVGGPTGPYAATRVARWLATFKDSTNAPFPMPGTAVDFGILQRVYLADIDEAVIVGPHPEFAPDVAGSGGGGGATFQQDSFVALAAQTLFTLSMTYLASGLSIIIVNGIVYAQGTDYTIAGTTLTWLNTPFVLVGGESVVAKYQIS